MKKNKKTKSKIKRSRAAAKSKRKSKPGRPPWHWALDPHGPEKTTREDAAEYLDYLANELNGIGVGLRHEDIGCIDQAQAVVSDLDDLLAMWRVHFEKEAADADE